MLSAEQNDLITRVGPGTPAGALLRRYWQPAALVDELSGNRPVKPVRLLGEDLVIFKDEQGRYGLIGRRCPHRGTDLAYGRLEDGGLRCAFHGWLFDVDGKCLQTPAEPDDSNLCANIRQKAYPVVEKSGILFAYMGPGEPPAFPHFDCFVAPATHTFAFKGMIDCNWLQSLEVGIDPVHTSFLHRFFNDEDPSQGYGKMFRDQSLGTDMPMTQIMREFTRPRIEVEPTEFGFRLVTLRQISDAERACARHQSDVPQRLHHPDEPRDDHHAVARAGRRREALLVRDLHLVRRGRGQGRDAPPAARALSNCPTTSRTRTRATITASIRTSRSTRPSPAWAPTSTCTTSGPASRWARSRTAPRSISAPPTRRSPPTAGCCGRRSSRSGRAKGRSWCSMRRSAASLTGPAAIDGIGPADDWQGYWQQDRRGQAQGRELGQWAVSLGVIVREGGRSSQVSRTFDWSMSLHNPKSRRLLDAPPSRGMTVCG